MTVRIEPETLRQSAGNIDNQLNNQRQAINGIKAAVTSLTQSPAFQGQTSTALQAKIEETAAKVNPQIQDAVDKASLIRQQADTMEATESEQQARLAGLGI